MKRMIFVASLAVWTCLAGSTRGDTVILVPDPDPPTGAKVDALAGPLFGSDMAVKDIAGTEAGSIAASLLGNTATHDYSIALDYTSGPAFFDSVFSGPFVRTATESHRASAESSFYFTVDSPAIYDIMGSFTVTDDVGTTIPGNVELEILLEEYVSFTPGSPPPTTLYYSYQVSKSTIDQSFVVGGTDGDFANVLTGSATGLLDPSMFYRYRTLVTINAIDIDGGGPAPATDGGASAVGGHLITFTSAVPEPGAIGLGIGVVLLSLVRRRR